MEASLDEEQSTLQAQLAQLHEAAPRFAELGPSEIAALLDDVRRRTLEVASAWVEAASAAKGLDPGSPLRGEEWVSGPWALLAGINGLLHTLRALARHHDPLSGFPIRARSDGQVVVRVFPANAWDALLLSGYEAEVWQQPGVTRDNLRDHVAARFRDGQTTTPTVSLVLGAGNINSIPPLDALYELVAKGRVCLVKLNPVNAYLDEPLNAAFAPLVDAGFVRFVRGDGAVGAWLAEHPLVDAVHITGSARVHDAIVFGSGTEGEGRKQTNQPRNPRPISSELGGIGGVLIVPGPWTAADFRFQAEHLVTQKLHNGGFNCVAAQVLVVSKGWSGTSRLLDEIRAVLSEVIENRPSYYPKTEERRAQFVDAHPDAQVIGTRNPFVMIEGLDPTADDLCFREEAFGPVWGVVALDESEPDAFLSAATEFANERLVGTLGCQLVIHPKTERRHAAALDRAIAGLRYGAVGVNAWSGAAFLLPNARWGAFPGHTLDDVQSGIGVVHNALLFDRPQKTVVRGPFQPFPRTLARGIVHSSPKPLWFVTHRKAERVASLLTRFEATRNVALLPPLFAAALTG